MMPFVSVPEAAKILGLSPATIRVRIKAGEWPYYSLGKRSIRLNLDEVMGILHLVAEGKPNGQQSQE